MKIDDTTINADALEIVTQLKEQLAERGIFLFAKFFDSGEDIMCCCPYHKNGQERRPSAGIRKSDGLFHCLACGETHSLPEVIGHCFNSDIIFGYKWLNDNFDRVIEQERQPINLNLTREPIKKIQESIRPPSSTLNFPVPATDEFSSFSGRIRTSRPSSCDDSDPSATCSSPSPA